MDDYERATKLSALQADALRSMRNRSAFVDTVTAAGLCAAGLARSTRRPGKYAITASGAALIDALIAGYDWRTRALAPLHVSR